MKKCTKNSLGVLFYLFVFSALCQEIPYGEWRNHLSFQSARILASGKNKIFCSTENGLFFYDRVSNASSEITKSDGLSEAGVTSMSYVDDLDVLLVGYFTGAIDLVYSDRVVNITTIRDIGQMNRVINDFEVVDQLVYAASDLGVILIDLEQQEARDIYNEIGMNGQNVQAMEVVVYTDTLFAWTDLGLIGGAVTDNLLDFNNWKTFISRDTLNVSNLIVFGDTLFMSQNDSIVKYFNGTWDIGPVLGQTVKSLSVQNEELLALSDSTLYLLNGTSHSIVINEKFAAGRMLINETEGYYLADEKKGLIRITSANDAITPLSPDGPRGDHPSKISISDQQVFLSYGTLLGNMSGIFGFDMFENGSWEQSSTESSGNISDIVTYQNDIFLSDFNDGLFRHSTGQQIPQFSGHTLSDISVYENKIFVADLTDRSIFESMDGTTWSQVELEPVDAITIRHTQTGTLWVENLVESGGGIVVHDPIENRTQSITISQGLPVNNITDMIIDRKDEAWIATEEGLVFFFNASFVEISRNAVSPFFSSGNLLQGDAFIALEVDGGNRRWLGTRKGLFLYDDDLNELFYHFTSGNSPLPSDHILDLCIDQSSGELFILTDRGLVSYQSRSSEPQLKHRQVKFIPSPVSRNITNSLTIVGLVADANVKITTISGEIVAEIRAYGSTASWNLRQYSGETVAPGVYLIFSSDVDGSETYVGKFAVVP